MSDRQMRELLEAVIDDIDAGRVKVRRAGRLVRLVGAGLVTATLGLSGGCIETSVGTDTDAAPGSDAVAQMDAAPGSDAVAQMDAAPISDAGVQADVWVDSGPVDTYGVSIDAAVAEDAEADAEIVYPPYAAPPVYDFTTA